MATSPSDPADRYDADLEMFVEPEHSLDLNVLNFLRWLVDTNRLCGDTAQAREIDRHA